MTYEETPISKKPSKTAVKKFRRDTLESYSTLALVWHIVKRHKIAILAAGNVVLVLNFIMPEWFQMLLGVVGR